MKKSLVILISIGLIVLLSVSFVSASWFGDFWKKITGRTTENDTSSGCADECSSDGTKQCSGSGYQTCGNYDSDLCLEWGSVTSCSSSETCVAGACVSNIFTCTDTDGGKDYNTQGNVVASSPTSSTDVTDLCSSSSSLVEYFCTNLQQSGETYTCPNGCSNGACISSTSSSTTSCSSDSDCAVPNPSWAGATFCDGTGLKLMQYKQHPTCSSGTCIYTTSELAVKEDCGASGKICEFTSSGGGVYACIAGTSPVSVSVTNPAISISPTTTASAGGGGGGGGSTSTITEGPEGIFEEKTITEEKIEGEIKITTETKKLTDEAGNKVEIEIKTEIKEDGTTIIEEKREFLNKEGKLIKLRFRFENDGENIKIKREVEVEGKKIESELEILEKFEGEEVQLKAKLSDGSEQEIKIMPDRASEIAIEKLKSKNLNVELKEVGEENNLKAVYIAKVDENGRLFGLFKVKLKSEAKIDSETGEILSLEKAWWNFLIIKLNEPQEIAGNQTNFTNITLPPPVNQTDISFGNQTNLTNITFPGNQTGNFSFNQTGNNTLNITNITLPPPINWSINYTCTDTDGGKNYSIKGNVIAKSPTSDINVTDLCSSSSSLVEYFCTNLQQSGETYTCPNGCSNGACV